MGLAAVTIDRCDRCSLFWLDANELQNMVLALAKTNYRSEQRRRDEEQGFDPLAAGVAATVPANLSAIANPLSRWMRPGAGAPQVVAQILLDLLSSV